MVSENNRTRLANVLGGVLGLDRVLQSTWCGTSGCLQTDGPYRAARGVYMTNQHVLYEKGEGTGGTAYPEVRPPGPNHTLYMQ